MTVSNKSILLVDDERHIRTSLRMILKRNSFEQIVEAANGNEALKLFREHRPDLVLLDLNMPHMDGIACLSELRATGIPAKVIILSAQVSERSVQDCLDGGADGFIRKDSPSEEIVRVIREALPA